MNDKLLMENYLLLLKSTTEVYVHGTLESSNDSVRKILKNHLDEILSSQGKTYDEMTNHDWYTINNISPDVILEKYECIKEEN